MKALVTVIAAAAVVASVWGDAEPARVQTVQVRAVDPAAFPDPPVRTYYLAAGASEADAIAAHKALIRAGARHVNLILPDRIIICELPLGATAERFAAPAGFVRLSREEAARSSAAWVRACYERVDRALAAPPSPPPAAGTTGGASAGFDDLLLVPTPEEVAAASREVQRWRAAGVSPLAGAVEERNMQQNSEILGGHIHAQFVFPESNGSIETESEDWSDDDLAAAIQGAFQAMLHWEGRFPKMDINTTFEYAGRAPTGYEPIAHTNRTDRLWIIDTLRMIGFLPAFESDNAGAIVHEYNNANRERTGADWAFTAFIACSRNEPGNIFRGADYTAYAFLGGPYMVEPFPAGGDPNGIGEVLVYSQIVNHEAGHIFWTLDEYIGAPGFCTDESGYLTYRNYNLSRIGPGGILRCVPYADCIMHSAAREDLFRPWCDYSQGHLGVIDWDNSGRPDIWESPPVIDFAVEGPETVQTNHVSVRFTARATAVPNRNPLQPEHLRVDYAPALGGATFALGTGAPHALAAADGAWDEDTEECVFEADIGSTGKLSIEFRVENAVGQVSPLYRKEIHFLGVNFSSLRVAVVEGEIRGEIHLEWDVRGVDFGAIYTVYRLGPGEEMPGTPIAEDVHGTDGRYRVVDDEVDPGRSYRYYVTGEFELNVEGVPRTFRAATAVVNATAMIPIGAAGMVSYVSPNPARDDMALSVVVPKTFIQVTAPGGVTQYPQRVATRVEVSVFDVAGRRVRRLHDDGEFRNVLTVHWDGRGDDGRTVPNGVYFIRVLAGSDHAVRKVLLLR
jgi:hypothetical protein